jgi:diguanylate cyclase (GGDEF)-like protein
MTEQPPLAQQPESGIRRLRLAMAVAFLAAFLMLSATIGFGLYEVQGAHRNLQQVMALHDSNTRLITETQVASYRRADAVLMLILETDPFRQDEVFMDYLRFGFAVGDGRNRIRALLTDPEALAVLASQDTIIAAAVPLHDRIADLSRAGSAEQAREIFTTEVVPLHEEGHATFQALRDLQTRDAQAAIAAAGRDYQRTLQRSVVAIVVSFALSIGIGLLMHFAGDRISRRLQANVGSLRYLAMHDNLTGLLNRGAITQQITQKLRGNEPFALLYMDLDGFKQANDLHGHELGDRFLTMAAARIRSRMRGVDAVARIGGDEFVALMHDVRKVEECEHAAQHIIEAFASPFIENHAVVQIGISIGIAIANGSGLSAQEMLNAADGAMYAAKREGNNCYRLAEIHDTAAVIDFASH